LRNRPLALARRRMAAAKSSSTRKPLVPARRMLLVPARRLLLALARRRLLLVPARRLLLVLGRRLLALARRRPPSANSFSTRPHEQSSCGSDVAASTSGSPARQHDAVTRQSWRR